MTELAVGQPATIPFVASKLRWLLAIVAGVSVSVAASVAYAAIAPGISSGNIGTVVGLVVGSVMTGVIVKAHGTRSWVNAILLTLAGQFALGLAFIMALSR